MIKRIAAQFVSAEPLLVAAQTAAIVVISQTPANAAATDIKAGRYRHKKIIAAVSAAISKTYKKFNENKSLESLRISRINSARQKIIFKTVSFPLAIELKPSPKRVSMSAGSNWLMISLSKQSTFTAPCNSIFITESV